MTTNFSTEGELDRGLSERRIEKIQRGIQELDRELKGFFEKCGDIQEEVVGGDKD